MLDLSILIVESKINLGVFYLYRSLGRKNLVTIFLKVVKIGR